MTGTFPDWFIPMAATLAQERFTGPGWTFDDGSDFVFAGKVGTGLDTRLLTDLRARLDALELTASPFTLATGLPRAKVHWVRPEIVVQVGFMEWTSSGKLRHPSLIGIREDKLARDVVREAP